MHDALMPPCIHKESTGVGLYDASSGKALLYLDDVGSHEKLTLKGMKLRRTGPPGCDETIDLRRLPPNIKPRSP
jgi:hypothetical protein